MYELLQNLLVTAWYGQPAGDADDVAQDDVTADGAGERLHRDLDACFQVIHEQISGRKQ
ncbi:hypothetical protein IG197_18395 [Aminobacter sp. SR38]|jgi:hypothetical protein|uniref:hypothetical protein n=1 Tax=Aminobacter TaxID=31988 RepID=UPI001784604E|nr:hypothetical protein [Aminobacter sp. SR38]QOF69810.1 hypothetical protein IG197_18395 [Aminobacter sp. SR38]